ncbi:MAG TPA: hypothetical protein VNA69_14785 [Thermoanaerobaculia bacterium]|nr:hypothetical protein [Thermoanaerobaculia bacterium]
MTATQATELETELRYFDEHRSELLREAAGKFALVKGEKLIGVFDSETAAIRHGYETLGNVPFLVKQVAEVDTVSVLTVSDTTPKAAAIQMELYRAASPSRRAQVAVDLSDAVRETTLAGIRRRHPEYSEREVGRSFLALVYGFDTEQ